MNDSQQMPKKISTQKYRIKSRINDQPKYEKSLQNHKQLQVSVGISNKKQIQSKSKHSQNNIKNKRNDKKLKSIPEIKLFVNKKTVQRLHKSRKSLRTQVAEVSCQTENPSKNFGAQIIQALKNKDKKELQDYEQEFLLKWRAKQFVTKLKKDKQETQKKLDIMRLEAQQKKQAKLLQIQEKTRIQQQNEHNKRREQAKHKIQEIKFKQERRKEELLLKDLHEKKLERSIRSSNVFNNEVDQKINELNRILHRRAKTRAEIEDIKTKQISPINRINSSILNVKDNKKSLRSQTNNIKNKSIELPKKISKMQQHLYLSIDDEKMLEDIKVKLQKLQTLRSQKVSKPVGKKKSKQRLH